MDKGGGVDDRRMTVSSGGLGDDDNNINDADDGGAKDNTIMPKTSANSLAVPIAEKRGKKTKTRRKTSDRVSGTKSRGLRHMQGVLERVV